MYKKTIKYTDFNDVDRADDFYFNFTKAELTEMEVEFEGGMQAYIQKIVDAKNNKEMIKLFKDLVLKAYGQKSEDGKRFIKNQQLRDEFEQTNAYSEFFMLLASNADEATKFVNGIMPKDLVAKAAEQGQIPASTTPIN